MIVVVGRVATNAEKRAELLRIGQAVATASRQEAGCLGYRLYEDTEVENDFVFIEEWESDEALRRHFGTRAHRRIHAGVSGDADRAAGCQVPHDRELDGSG